jgi:protein xylosyltransferase
MALLESSEIQASDVNLKGNNKKVKIVFLLTLNGRAIRQIYRLLRALYDSEHYYYIHVDSVSNFIISFN